MVRCGESGCSSDLGRSFKELKRNLAVRPIVHQQDRRIEAHIFVTFIAYYLHVTLKKPRPQLCPGPDARAGWTSSPPCRWWMSIRPPPTVAT